ncbi:MAG: hypothetical protein GY950_30795, partial [bacterium]|nr:hypothetical protein [bacterium]
MTRKKRYLFLPVFILFALLCRGNQNKPSDPYRYYTGFKYQQNYTALTYGASNQNWAVLQDPRGILYFANQAGVLEYDGTSWEFIEIPNHTARSMDRDADDADGTIYVGGINEIGYLQPDGTGKLKYVSLLPHLEKEHHNFAEVYQTYCDHGTTWFRSYKKLFRWRDGKFKVWDTSGTKTDFKIIFSWKGKCFVQRKSIGIVEVIGDSFQKLPGNKIF